MATSKSRKVLISFAVLFVLLLALRIALPYIVLHYVNKQLSEMKEYTGHVDDIDIALIRGAYTINDISIRKIENEMGKSDTIPFFKSPEIDLSVEWSSLFKGRIVGEIYVEDPEVNFVKGKHKNEDLKADTADFKQLVKNLMPLTVNHFQINNGIIRYVDQQSKPKVDLAMKDIYATATNLSNVNKSNKALPAKLVAEASAYDGRMTVDVDFDALNKAPTFDLNARVENVNMVHLNDFFKAYGNFDLKKGNFGLYAEFAAKDQAFNGYVKPVVKDLDIVQWNKEEGNLGQILWETLIGSAAEIFQNQSKEQFATKIPISGRFDSPKTDLWGAIGYVLRNAFVYALKPSIDESINIANVDKPEKKNFFQRVFSKDEKEKEEKDQKKKDK